MNHSNQNQNEESSKLACFIHSTNLELWKDSYLLQILDHVKASSLLSQLDYLCIMNTGLPLDVQMIERKYAPAKVIHYSNNTQEFENVTIKQLYTFSTLHPQYKILYMHTKGVSYPPDHVFLPGIHSWNSFMRYSLIDHFTKCARLLQIYDTVGCNYRPLESGNGPHYSGNYWWATARYISTLKIDYLKNKYDPEFWLLQNKPLYFNIYTMEHMYEQIYPIEKYTEDIGHGFDDVVLFSKVGFYKTGLCNQLYCIANTLTLAAAQDGNKVVILDDFIEDIDSNMSKPASLVLDIPTCNEHLKPYGITVMYKNSIVMTLDKVLYGLRHENVIDITEEVKQKFWKPNHLFIPKGVFLNDVVKKDPCPNLRKQVYVYYSLNGVPLQRVFYEQKLINVENIEIKHSNYDGKQHRSEMDSQEPWLTRINRNDSRQMIPLFDRFLNLLSFQSEFYQKAQTFIEAMMKSSSTFHVIHLRNEHDAIAHWSTMNKMSPSDYRMSYETKIMNCVRKHIVSKNEPIVILSSLVEKNQVMEQLTKEGYTLYSRNKEPIGREMNGIIDLIIGKICNGVFIGNYNLELHQGSTFSYVLYNSLCSHTTNILIDMDHIERDAVIKYI